MPCLLIPSVLPFTLRSFAVPPSTVLERLSLSKTILVPHVVAPAIVLDITPLPAAFMVNEFIAIMKYVISCLKPLKRLVWVPRASFKV